MENANINIWETFHESTVIIVIIVIIVFVLVTFFSYLLY